MNVFKFWIVFIAMTLVSTYLGHKSRLYCQQHKVAYEIMLFSDAIGFVCNGGDSFGYGNYFKWSYAKWINSPDRNIIERLLFWNFGIIYDATNPSAEYQYPLKV